MDHNPNLLRPESSAPEAQSAEAPVVALKKRKKFSPLANLVFFGACIMGISAFLLFAGIAKSTPYDEGDSLSIFATLARLIPSRDKSIAGESDDRINVLLLGVGGAGHDGPELTDTMIFGSFRPSTKELGLISIPRDLTVFIPGQGYRKINAVNALAEQAKSGSGQEKTADVVEDILGQNVHYTVKIDFGGFGEIIDALGGIDVYVERSFTDATYPLDDGLGGVTTVSFTQGWTHMDGGTALAYARSRHGGNGEGSDFSRAARQQKILLALKDRALSMDVILNPTKLSRIMGIVQKNVETNLTAVEMLKFAAYIPDISADRLAMHVLDATSGLLYETNVNGAYVLLPYEEDWSDLHALALNIYVEELPGARTPVITKTNETALPPITVEIQNGTLTTGLAGETAQLLASSGFTISLVTNAEDRDQETTTVYDFTNGEKADELAALTSYLNAKVVMTKEGALVTHDVIPDTLIDPSALEEMKKSTGVIDFLIILGEDSSHVVLR